MSKSEEWYTGVVDRSIETIVEDVQPLVKGCSGGDNNHDEAQEIIDQLKRACKKWKGTRRAT